MQSPLHCTSTATTPTGTGTPCTATQGRHTISQRPCIRMGKAKMISFFLPHLFYNFPYKFKRFKNVICLLKQDQQQRFYLFTFRRVDTMPNGCDKYSQARTRFAHAVEGETPEDLTAGPCRIYVFVITVKLDTWACEMIGAREVSVTVGNPC